MTSRRVLREYVKSVLLEDDSGYGDYDMSGLGDSPYGMHWGGPSLYKVFVQPFTDVFQTARAGAENVSARARSLAKVAFEGLATSIIPALSSDYEQIFEKEHEQLRKIREKYRPVFDRTDRALGESDVGFVAFMLNPAAVVTTSVLRKAPLVALDIFETLAGENRHLRALLSKLKITSRRAPAPKNYKANFDEFLSGLIGDEKSADVSVWREGLVLEGPERDTTAYLAKILSHPAVQKQLSRSSVIQSMKKDAQTILNSTASALMLKYDKLSHVQDTSGIAQLFPNVDKTKIAAVQKLPPQERAATEKMLVDQVKASSKKFYEMALDRKIREFISAGVSESNPLVMGYKKVLDRVKSS